MTTLLDWQEVWDGIWVMLGVLAGAGMQILVARHNARQQGKFARRAFVTELRINLVALDDYEARINHLATRISSGQAKPEDLHIRAETFNYSAMMPLINSGHFHTILSPDDVTAYFRFQGYFNIRNAEILTQILQHQHSQKLSLDFLDHQRLTIQKARSSLRELEARCARG